MDLDKRAHVYRTVNGRRDLTRRQWRRFRKKAWRDEQTPLEVLHKISDEDVRAIAAETGEDEQTVRDMLDAMRCCAEEEDM